MAPFWGGRAQVKNYKLGNKDIRRIQHIKLETAYPFAYVCFLVRLMHYISLVLLAAYVFYLLNSAKIRLQSIEIPIVL